MNERSRDAVGDRRRRRNTGLGRVGSHVGRRQPAASPAYPTLQVPLAVTAVGRLGLGVAAVTVTQCVQLHGQLLGEAKRSEPQKMGLWEAAGSLESNQKVHLRTRGQKSDSRSCARAHARTHAHPKPIHHPEPWS